MTTDDVLLAADRNMRDTWRGVIAAAPTGQLAEDGEVVLMSSGSSVPLFNPAFVTGPTAGAGQLIRRVVDHYASLALPFVLYFRDATTPGLGDACVAAGLVEHWQPPLMVLDPIPSAPTDASLPDGVTIAPVTAATLDGYLATMAAGFELPGGLLTDVFNESLLAIDGFTAVLATRDSVPAATSGVFVTGDMAGVYNVATLPEHRGRGIGAAVTWAAVRAGAAAGATRAILQSSSDGEPVYRRMGFTTPDRYRQFEPPSDAQPGA